VNTGEAFGHLRDYRRVCVLLVCPLGKAAKSQATFGFIHAGNAVHSPAQFVFEFWADGHVPSLWLGVVPVGWCLRADVIGVGQD
jgi:hypothetical protein